LAKLQVIGETKYPKEELTRVIERHLKSKLHEIQRQIMELEETANKLERKYAVSWEDFQEKFVKRELGEDADLDYVEWHATMELLKELNKERDLLTEVLS